MELYFLRHGIAANLGPAGTGDAGRPLTEDGVIKMAEEARGMRLLGMQLDVLLASPFMRARQTAEIVGKELGVAVQIADALRPGCDVARLRALLGEHQGAKRVMVVGHEPDFSEMVGSMAGNCLVQMQKGGLARIDLPLPQSPVGTFVWLFTPNVLRSIR